MTKYGSTAVQAVGLLRDGYKSADQAWRTIAGKVFAGAPKARDKVCPREAFLGLCAAGLIRGVSPGTCSGSSDSPNRSYSVTAVRLLSASPELVRGTKIGLWRLVMTELGLNTDKKPNEQMGVVLALWERDLITARAAVSRAVAKQ